MNLKYCKSTENKIKKLEKKMLMLKKYFKF